MIEGGGSVHIEDTGGVPARSASLADRVDAADLCVSGCDVQGEVHEALAQAGLQDWFLYYLMGTAVITLVIGLLMKETREVRLER